MLNATSKQKRKFNQSHSFYVPADTCTEQLICLIGECGTCNDPVFDAVDINICLFPVISGLLRQRLYFWVSKNVTLFSTVPQETKQQVLFVQIVDTCTISYSLALLFRSNFTSNQTIEAL